MVKILGHDVDVVALGVERRDAALRPLLAVVLVVVVGPDVGDVLLAEESHQAARDGGLSARRVADDAEDHRARSL
ncbi:MAG: hypothetical protein WKF31_10560 [Thermoleophilaceae bacterium]